MSRIKVIVPLAVLTAMLALAGYKLSTVHVAASAHSSPQPSPQSHEDLRRFMQDRVHHEYTFLSFTIWHDRPLTPAKLDSIAASSARVMDLSKELGGYSAVYKEQGWGSDDVKFFDEKRLQLSRVAEELHSAAQKHDSTEVINFFMHLDSTCQSCHKRFRPNLQWL
ncbi:MAG TPA: cytochrome c [Candidatus Angelobacter sp.]|jgi:cytochrome c556